MYRPGCLEHYVLHCLRKDESFVPELDFVMEKDGKLIGQNMFMRAIILAVIAIVCTAISKKNLPLGIK